MTGFFLTQAGLILDGDNLKLTSTDPADLNVAIYPPPDSVECSTGKLTSKSDGIFRVFSPHGLRPRNSTASFTQVETAGPPREIPRGDIQQPVATAPLDADFAKAAVWRVTLPSSLDLSADPLLRFRYVGDVARLMLDGRFITDDFYNGNVFEIGLRRHAPEILNGELRIAILPLRQDAPIYMSEKARPDFGHAGSIATLQSVEIIPRYHWELTAR